MIDFYALVFLCGFVLGAGISSFSILSLCYEGFPRRGKDKSTKEDIKNPSPAISQTNSSVAQEGMANLFSLSDEEQQILAVKSLGAQDLAQLARSSDSLKVLREISWSRHVPSGPRQLAFHRIVELGADPAATAYDIVFCNDANIDADFAIALLQASQGSTLLSARMRQLLIERATIRGARID